MLKFEVRLNKFHSAAQFVPCESSTTTVILAQQSQFGVPLPGRLGRRAQLSGCGLEPAHINIMNTGNTVGANLK